MYDQEIITIKKLHNKYIITFNTKKINILNISKIETKLINLVSNTKYDIYFDLSNIEFIDSSGFIMLNKLKINSHKIKYINIGNELKDLMNFINKKL